MSPVLVYKPDFLVCDFIVYLIGYAADIKTPPNVKRGRICTRDIKTPSVTIDVFLIIDLGAPGTFRRPGEYGDAVLLTTGRL